MQKIQAYVISIITGSEEHTSELQSSFGISYALVRFEKKKNTNQRRQEI